MRIARMGGLLVVAFLVGCGGTVGTPDGITYNDLAGASPGAATNALELDLKSSVVAASTAHVGELDILQASIGRLTETGRKIGEENILLTIEAANGTVLGAQPLGLATLREDARSQPAGVAQVIERAQHLRVPRELLSRGEFRANLFVCIDADADGACGDQLVEEIMGGSSFEGQQVVAFVPLRASYDGTRLAAVKLIAGQEGYSGADAFMERTLSNYDPALFGGGEGSLLVLAAHAAVGDAAPSDSGGSHHPGGSEELPPAGEDPDPADPMDPTDPTDPTDPAEPLDPDECDLDDCMAMASPVDAEGQYQEPDWEGFRHCMDICDITERDNGCFVAGTRIAVGEGEWLPIERLRPGSSVLTADGTLAKVVKAVSGPEEAPIVSIVTPVAVLRVTRDHPMSTTRGIKRADALGIDDRLLVAGGRSAPISALQSEIYRSAVFNIALEGSSNTVIAEGIVTGDLTVQEALGADAVVVGAR